MIKVQDLYKSFGTVDVLRGVNLDINRSEVVSIVGPSGAGKTTLLQIIGTLGKADRGYVEINGIRTDKMNDRELSQFRGKNIGFVFQFHNLLPEFTALENVIIPALIAGESQATASARAKELLCMMGLGDRLTHKPAQMSGGEQQRVAIARAVINSPSVLLADEPSGNLDSKNREEIHSLFFKLRDQMGQTTVIVTHDEHLASMADRKIEMIDGVVKL